MLSTKEQTTLRVAQLVSLALMAMVFFYPIVAAARLDAMARAGALNLGDQADWETRILVILAAVSLLSASRMSRLVMRGAKGDREQRIRRWISAVIVGQVCRELAATIGLLLTLLSHHLSWCFLIGLLSFLSMGRNWPKAEEIERL